MFVFSVSKKRVRLVGIISLLIILCMVLFMVSHKNIDVSSQNISSEKLETTEEKIAYIANYGYEVDPEPFAIQEIILPQDFDDTLLKYNELQKSQGFDLIPFCGKRIKKWSFKILNDSNSSNQNPILVNIYLYNQKVIAGDVSSTKLDGFMHGLSKS